MILNNIFSKISKSFIVAAGLIFITVEADGQILKVIKGLIKGGKETTEQVARKGAKESIGHGSKEVVAKTVKKSLTKNKSTIPGQTYRFENTRIAYGKANNALLNLKSASRLPYNRIAHDISKTGFPTNAISSEHIQPSLIFKSNIENNLKANGKLLESISRPSEIDKIPIASFQKSAAETNYRTYKNYYEDKVADIAARNNLSSREQNKILRRLVSDPDFARTFRNNPNQVVSQWKNPSGYVRRSIKPSILSGNAAYKSLKDLPEIQKSVRDLNKFSSSFFRMEDLCVEQVGKSKKIYFKGTKTSMEIEGDVIKAQPGSFTVNGKSYGQVNKFLSNPLPDKTYLVEDGLITYRTDKLGRVKYIKCESSDLYNSLRHKNIIRNGTYDSKDKDELFAKWNMPGSDNSQYDYGHLVRRELGGPNELINALPMKKSLQRSGSEWFKLENDEINACKAGKKVSSEMKITYLENGKYEISVKKVMDGRTVVRKFQNLF